MEKFSDLALVAPILEAIQRQGYAKPTPIQIKAIPAIMAGSDLLGIAQTGTGKTAAFALPILHHITEKRGMPGRKSCRALILSPTRELAAQIADNFKNYSQNLDLKIAVVFGGVAPTPQIRALSNGVDILIATPGRLLDHIEGGDIVLAGSEILVLDEADQMLDLGFVKPIRRVVKSMSSKRQTLMFSATMPPDIAKLAKEFLQNPVTVTVAPVSSTADRIAQRIIYIEKNKKRALLTELFSDSKLSRALVFTRTKHGADRVARHLNSAGILVAAIHGNKSQNQRARALSAFRSSKVRVLVATDIAARGIDVDDVSHVINYELPDAPEAYVHRIGRTARAGASGLAISLCDRSENSQLKAIERLTRQSIPSENRYGDTTLNNDERRTETGKQDRNKRNRPDRAPKKKTWQRKTHHKNNSKNANERSEARSSDRKTKKASDNAASKVHENNKNRDVASHGSQKNENRVKHFDHRNGALSATPTHDAPARNNTKHNQSDKSQSLGHKRRGIETAKKTDPNRVLTRKQGSFGKKRRHKSRHYHVAATAR